ncbi:hypothetical protein KC19_3G237800 [Ceratodon purpureus]|uniref:Uncharacterized protein n=1 Tax=Ceratodon purpureus TaxID=3225 RepID=A0A8T0IPT5_CERPU|nr:hypothetical protein KC19_3G237800 [Ceratodon purpureus]
MPRNASVRRHKKSPSTCCQKDAFLGMSPRLLISCFCNYKVSPEFGESVARGGSARGADSATQQRKWFAAVARQSSYPPGPWRRCGEGPPERKSDGVEGQQHNATYPDETMLGFGHPSLNTSN